MTAVTAPVTQGDSSGLWVPVADLARMRGVARQVMYRKVDRLIASGAMEVRADARGTKLVSPAQFDHAVGQVGDLARMQGAETRRQADAAPPPAPPPPEGDVGPIYTREQARNMAYRADLAQLELQERLGNLCSVGDLKEAAERAFAEIVRVVDRLPQAADDLAAALTRDGVHGVRASLKTVARQMRADIAAALAAVPSQAASQTGDGAPVAGITDEGTGPS